MNLGTDRISLELVSFQGWIQEIHTEGRYDVDKYFKFTFTYQNVIMSFISLDNLIAAFFCAKLNILKEKEKKINDFIVSTFTRSLIPYQKT